MLQNVDARQLKDWLESDAAMVVDVRGAGEYAAGHIPGALNVPGESAMQQTPAPCGRRMVLACRSGRRSEQVAQAILARHPAMSLFHLVGGVKAWQDAGQPLESSGGPALPLDRQVQVAVGSMVFLFTLLGAVASPWFLLLSGFMGAGLTFAGLSGFCGLAILLQKMPWNRTAAGCQGPSCSR